MYAKFFRVVDYFLPANAQAGESRLRARTAILLILISGLFVSLTVAFGMLRGVVTLSQAKLFFVVVIAEALYLLLIKKTSWLEWVTTSFLALLVGLMTLDCIYSSQSFHVPSLQIFPVLLLFAFFVCPGLKLRLIFSGFLLFCTVSIVFVLRERGFAVPYDMDPQVFVRQLILSTYAKMLIGLSLVTLYLHMKRVAEQDFLQDVTWQLQSLRLSEISMMTQLMVPHLLKPLEEFDARLEKMMEAESWNEQIHLQLKASVLEMTQMAQGTGWIYKAFRNESVSGVSSQQFHRQITYLLNRKLESRKFQATVNSKAIDDFELEGPIPSVMLLILSLFDDLTYKTDHSIKNLDISLCQTLNQVLWTMDLVFDHSSAKANLKDKNPSIETLRDELVNDLRNHTKAVIRTKKSDMQVQVEIEGAWRSEKLSGIRSADSFESSRGVHA